MTAYRTAARETWIPEPPVIPDRAALALTVRWSLSARIAVGSGCLGWLLVAMSVRAHDAMQDHDFERVAPPPSAPLVAALPALVWTAALAFVVVRRAVVADGDPGKRTVRGAMLAGGVSGFAFAATRLIILVLTDGGGRLDLALLGSIVLGVLALGCIALLVSVPLGGLFGLGYAGTVEAACTELACPSVFTPARVDRIGARSLAAAAPLALLLEVGCGGHTWGAVAAALGALAVAAWAHSRRKHREAQQLLDAVRAARHPALAMVALDDAIAGQAIRLDTAPDAPAHAVVARVELAHREAAGPSAARLGAHVSGYRLAPPGHPDAPRLPTAAEVVATSRRSLSICIGLASGVVGWLLVARVPWLIAVSNAEPWPRGLLFALPALVWTTLLAGRVAHVSLETGVVPLDTLGRSAGAGALNGLLCVATYVLLGGIAFVLCRPDEVGVGSVVVGIGLGIAGTAVFGFFATLVSVPLGFVFGLSYALVLERAAALAARPSMHTVPETASLGARYLALSAVVALLLEGGVAGWTHGACALSLLGLALAAAGHGLATRRRSEEIQARIHAGAEPGLALVPLEVTDASEAIRLELDRPPDAAVVSRVALAEEERPRALALTSWCYRRAAMAGTEPR